MSGAAERSGEPAAWQDLSSQHASMHTGDSKVTTPSWQHRRPRGEGKLLTLTNDACLAGATAWCPNVDLVGDSILPTGQEPICDTVACYRMQHPWCSHWDRLHCSLWLLRRLGVLGWPLESKWLTIVQWQQSPDATFVVRKGLAGVPVQVHQPDLHKRCECRVGRQQAPGQHVRC